MRWVGSTSGHVELQREQRILGALDDLVDLLEGLVGLVARQLLVIVEEDGGGALRDGVDGLHGLDEADLGEDALQLRDLQALDDLLDDQDVLVGERDRQLVEVDGRLGGPQAGGLEVAEEVGGDAEGSAPVDLLGVLLQPEGGDLLDVDERLLPLRRGELAEGLDVAERQLQHHLGHGGHQAQLVEVQVDLGLGELQRNVGQWIRNRC